MKKMTVLLGIIALILIGVFVLLLARSSPKNAPQAEIITEIPMPERN